MSQHTITAEIKVQFRISGMPEDERETAYPKVEITYTFTRGADEVRYQSNGDPGYPAEPHELEFISAKLIDGDGLEPEQYQLTDWAEEWLQDEGYDQACRHAEAASEPDPDFMRDLREEDAREFVDLGDDQC